MTCFQPSNLALAFATAVVVVSALTLFRGRRRVVRGSLLPPGPVPLPFVGNIFGIDAKKPWITYAKWAARYGDIFTIRVLKQDIIVISSEKIAKELLERRSSIYSDRPHLAARDPFGWSFNFAWVGYGERWRSQRKIFHQTFRPESTLTFQPIQLKKSLQLVLDILNTPHDYSAHIQKFSSAVIMSIVYDYEVAPSHDRLVELFERGNALALGGLTPETSSILDAFPFVLRLPAWFPGAVLKRKAVISYNCAMKMITEPFEHARKRQAAGSSTSAMAIDLLKGMKDTDDISQLELLRDTCATAFVAGAETTASTLQCFMFAMLQHPEVQEHAQAEIDAIIGANRLPNFDDRPNLPYVEAVLLETLRMYAVAPLAIPHGTTADDVYEEFFIPKGSTVVANIWAMHHNKDIYPEPDIFKPERFFKNGRLNGDKSVDSLAYGFGRRACPGRYAADSSVWAAMVSILCIFKITKALDDGGKEIDFEPTFTTGVTTCPNPFPCAITPRLSKTDTRKLAAVDI